MSLPTIFTMMLSHFVGHNWDILAIFWLSGSNLKYKHSFLSWAIMFLAFGSVIAIIHSVSIASSYWGRLINDKVELKIKDKLGY